jgi:hypothetical protein
MTPKTYEIVKTGQFNIDVARLSKKVKRLDEFIVGVSDYLSRSPELGKPTKNRIVLALKMRPLPDNPGLTVYYYHTRTQVFLIFLRMDGDTETSTYNIL